MGLRVSEGLNLTNLAATTGHRICAETLRMLEGDGLVQRSSVSITLKATRQGQLVLNRVIEALAGNLQRVDPVLT
jgi:coproporphyrinogen III oxidase-like Fe-S oxidoreductase